MAMASCRECGHEVSDEAPTCPNCGVRKPVKRTSLLAVALLVLAGFWVLGWLVSTDSGTATGTRPAPSPTPAPQPELELSIDSCTRRGGSLWVEGSVRNTGAVTVNFVQVRTTFEDGDGGVVDTGSTYAVGGEMLRPGEASAFSHYTNHTAAARCVASVLSQRPVR